MNRPYVCLYCGAANNYSATACPDCADAMADDWMALQRDLEDDQEMDEIK